MTDVDERQGLDRFYEPFTEEERSALREILDLATPGQYERLAGDYGRRVGNESMRIVTGKSRIMLRVETPDPQHHNDAAYAVTFSPPMVRRLLNAVDRLSRIEATLASLGDFGHGT